MKYKLELVAEFEEQEDFNGTMPLAALNAIKRIVKRHYGKTLHFVFMPEREEPKNETQVQSGS